MTNSKKVTTNLLWRFAERFGAQIVTFIVSIVLARLLDPTVYGVVALLTIFITIMQVFVDSGLGTALIQKKDADQLDFSTVFYANLVYCGVLYLLLFFLAPLIAGFYDNSDLTSLIRVLGITILISGVKNVEQAYVSKHMMFKKFFWATLIGTLTSAVVGIIMAINGFGPWALIAQSLTNAFIDTVVLWIIVKWRPTKEFSFKRLRQLYKFGWKLLASALLETGYNELRQLIIGKKYSSEQLAFYNKGKQFPNLIATNINSSIDSVLLPTMSSEQEHKERVRAMTRRALKTSVFLMAPMMVGIAAVGNGLITLLLGEKWLDSVFFLRIFCITFIFYPIHTANLNAMKAMGRSDYFLILEVIKKAIGIASILITMWISVEAIAWSLLITTAISMVVNAFPNKKLLNYSYFDQLKDILPAVIIAGTMGVGVYMIEYIPSPNYLLTMFVQIIVGIVFYVVVCRLFKLESYFYVKNMVLDFVKTKIVHKNNSEERLEENEASVVNLGMENHNEGITSNKRDNERVLKEQTGSLKTQQKKPRDSGLELFRILVMVLIIAHHYVVNSGLMQLIYENPLMPQSIFLSLFGAWGKIGINCFVLITGYFMCSSNITPKKFAKLLLEVLFYKIVIGIVFFATGYQEFNIIQVIKMLLPVTSVATNFTGCYLLFFLFIPFLNILIRHMSKKQHGLLLILLLFIYSILYTLPKIDVVFNYVTWFIVLYFCGSYLKLYPFSFDKSKKVWGLLSLTMIIISAGSVIGFLYLGTKLDTDMAYLLVSDSNRVTALITGVCLFMFFKNIHFHSRIVNVIASTTFGVLLIHTNSDAMRHWLWGDLLKNVEMFNSPYIYVHAVGFVLTVFLVCMLIDIIRTYAFEKPLFKWLDNSRLLKKIKD